MTQELPEPVRFIRRPWRRNRLWSGLARGTASITAFAFLLTQVALPVARATEQNDLPRWLRQEEGGWLSPEQANRLQRADQDLLNHLSALQEAQDRFVLTHPSSGLQTLFVRPELVERQPAEVVVSRDAAGNLLWSPTLDDYQKLQNGTLLLADGTLQVVRDGRLNRQVDVMGNEAVYRADGRVDFEIAVDGTRTDYAYSEFGFTRTIHNPDGDLVQEYNAEGRLVRETTPAGTVSTYSNGILATVTAGGYLYTYSSAAEADGTITATLSEARGTDGAVYTLSRGVAIRRVPSAASILLVDSEKEALETVRLIFDARGITCWTATSGSQALELLKEHQPDFILSEITLRNDNASGISTEGFDLLQAAKKVLPERPVYLLTALDLPEFRDKARELGADGFLVKPASRDQLIGLLPGP